MRFSHFNNMKFLVKTIFLILTFFSNPAASQSWGPECQIGVHPDRWDQCSLFRHRIGEYQAAAPSEQIRNAVNMRIHRSLQITGDYWGTPNRLLFKNGVVTLYGKDIKIDSSKYNAAELAKLQGNINMARSIEINDQARIARAQAESQQKAREELNLLRRQCTGRPSVPVMQLETLSNSLRTNPSQIELNRVEFNVTGLFPTCDAVFRHPRGVAKCNVQFDSRGRVAEISKCSG